MILDKKKVCMGRDIIPCLEEFRPEIMSGSEDSRVRNAVLSQRIRSMVQVISGELTPVDNKG